MITQDTARTLLGSQACDANGEELGTVDSIYVDDQTDTPEFAAVRGSGSAPMIVPLVRAEERDGVLSLAYAREELRDAPPVGGEDALSQEEQARLYAYYGLDYTVTVTDEDTVRLHRSVDGEDSFGALKERQDVWVERDPVSGEGG